MNSQLTVRCVVVLAVALLGGSRAHSAYAVCDTPVYRFAMYSKKWAPWPYVVVYLHSGEEAKEDAVDAVKDKFDGDDDEEGGSSEA